MMRTHLPAPFVSLIVALVTLSASSASQAVPGDIIHTGTLPGHSGGWVRLST